MAMKRLSVDEEAVSEVVSAILTLLVTVVLFSSVFATVQQLDGPDERVRVDLEADFGDSGDLMVTHTGGDRLDTEELSFFLSDESGSYPVSEGEVDLPGSSWSIGEIVEISMENYDIEGELELMIRHDETSRVIFDSILIEEGNIVDIRNAWIDYEVDWRDHAEPGDEITIRARVTAPVWKSSESFDAEEIDLYASIGESDVLFDNDTLITPDDNIYMNHTSGGRFEKTLQVNPVVREERHRIRLSADQADMYDIDPNYIFLNIGKEPVDYYEEELVIGSVRLDPGSPSHGDDFAIEAEIFNEGEIYQYASWQIIDDRQGEFGDPDDYDQNISAGAAPTFVRAEYPEGIKGHDAHEITFRIIPEDEGWEGDEWEETVYVDPNVLVVRDNLHSESNEGELMEYALRSLNLDTEDRILGEEVDLDDLEDTVARHSVTIWMVGNHTDEELNLDDSDVLEMLNEYVEGELEDMPVNGGLWLVGSGLADFGGADDFEDLGDKLGIQTLDDDPAPFEEERHLVNPEYDENGTYGDFEYGVSAGEYLEIDTLKYDHDESNILVFDDENNLGGYMGVGYESDNDQRTAVNPFIFDSIHDPGQQASMAGEVIEWLSNMTTRTGVDVSVTSQMIEPTDPMFMDQITIESTLRNNGPEDLNVDVVALRNHGEEMIELDQPVSLPKNGGTETVTFDWTANELGTHEFLVTADYYNQIDEVWLGNNDIRYKDVDVTRDNIEVNVHFSSLVVDATDPESYGYEDTVGEITDSFDRLGHREGRDYEVKDVDEVDYETMQEYNAVIWVTGERGQNDEDVFTDQDIEDVESYLERPDGANMMFVGENILDFLSGEEEELMNKMGVESYEGDVSSDHLIGVEGSNLGHSLRYEIGYGQYASLETGDDSEPIFTDIHGNKLASTYDDGDVKTVYMGVNPGRIEGPLLEKEDFDDWPGDEDVDISRENAREEFFYNTIWNFGKRDERTELRVTDYDIEFSSDNPQTGRSYQIDARIENVGYSGSSALVRIREGRDHIGSQTVFVEGSERRSEPGSSHFEVSPGSTTIELSWSPMHGGERPIRVRVDPLRGVDEIAEDDEEDGAFEDTENKIMEFNNQAKVDHPVYYFYDDMEHGEDKWSHDSTLMNIDGESPLDFMSAADGEHTNVEGDWDWDLSGSTDLHGNIYSGEGEGVYQTRDPEINQFTDNASYSPPRSYWMAEGPGDPEGRARRPLDLVILIDSGATVRGDQLTDIKNAARAAVNLTEEEDRIALLDASSGRSPADTYPDDGVSLEYVEGNEDEIESFISNIDADAEQKNLLDGNSQATYILDEDGRDNAVKGIISLTDGLSNQDGRQEERYRYTDSGRDETEQEGAVQWYDGRTGELGLLGIPYNILTITVGNKIEPRQHWISATSTADISYGVVERETENLKSVFQMYVRELIESERGDLRSIPGNNLDPSEDNDISMDHDLSSNPDPAIEDTQFVVYSDAFTTNILDADGYWDEGSVPRYNNYSVFEWEPEEELHHQGDRIHITTDSNGQRISNIVEPSNMLGDLEGEYDVKGAYVNFLLNTPDQGQNRGSISLEIDNETVFTGLTADEGHPQTQGEYIERDISDYIAGDEPFSFEFQHDGDEGGEVQLDDITFTYEIDFYPEDHEYDQKVGSNRTYRYMTTPSVEIGDSDQVDNAILEFQQKYKATEGTAGGFIYLWGKEDETDDWEWRKDNRLYVEPEQSYTGNLNLDRIDEHNEEGGPGLTDDDAPHLEDRHGNLPYWVFNGKSADRTFDWSYTSVDIGRHEEFLDDHEEVKAVFMFAQFGGITRDHGWTPEMGWYVDNVRMRVSRGFEDEVPEDDDHGYWMRVNEDDVIDIFGEIDNDHQHIQDGYYQDNTKEDGEGHYWMFANNSGGEPTLPKGVDSSLYTHPIYLENAEDPRLSAYLKFNIDDGAGNPPDGFRVEVSDDDGRSWDSLTYGARAAWNASGTDEPIGDAYSGTTDDEHSDEYGWVDSSSLHRLSADLSGWRGETIRLRFRVFTNMTEKYDDPELPKAIFIDDVVVAESDMHVFDERNTAGKSSVSGSEGSGSLTSSSLDDLEEETEPLHRSDSYVEDIVDIYRRPRPTIDIGLPNTRKSQTHRRY